MRILIAGLIGGIVMFIWGVVAHMALPLGQVGIDQPVNEDVVLIATKTGLPPQDGIYMLPSFDMAKEHGPADFEAFSRKNEASPYAFIVYNAQGRDPVKMGGNIARQWASDTLGALVVAFILAFTAVSFGRRVMFAGLFGVFAWLTVSVPQWNWYRFPFDFTFASLIEQVIGWLLAGAAIAWWLGRAPRGTESVGARQVRGI